MLYFLCSRMSRKFESERPEIYVIWWNDGLLGYNVNVSDDQQPIQKSKWCIFLNKLSIVENTKKINKWKKLKQNVGPWWCVHVCKSYNCRLKQIQGSSQLEVVNSKRCFFFNFKFLKFPGIHAWKNHDRQRDSVLGRVCIDRYYTLSETTPSV
jgi:hypothetical protein